MAAVRVQTLDPVPDSLGALLDAGAVQGGDAILTGAIEIVLEQAYRAMVANEGTTSR